MEEDNQRKWIFDTEYTTDSYDFDEIPYPFNRTYSFNSPGHKTIKLEYWSITKYWDWDCWCNTEVLDATAWGGINVVDCDYTSNYYFYDVGFGNPLQGFINSSVDYWAYNNWNGSIFIYGGSFSFNGNASNYLNSNKYELSACSEIVINGDVEFIASGNNELILTSGDIPNCNGSNKNTILANDTTACNSNNELKAELYPNPFINEFKIEIEQEIEQDINIEVTDMQGKIIEFYNKKNVAKGINIFEINANKYEKAIYIVKVSNKEKSKVFKVVKTIN